MKTTWFDVITAWITSIAMGYLLGKIITYDTELHNFNIANLPASVGICYGFGIGYICLLIGRFNSWNFNPDNYVEVHRVYGNAHGEWSAKGFSIDSLDLYNTEDNFKWIADNDEHPFNLYPHTKKGEPLIYSEE